MNDELRPQPVPPPPASPGQLPPDKLPGPGRPPIPAGTPMFSDYTRKQLEAIGWQEGDPIPGDLGQRLKAIQAEVQAQERVASPWEGTPEAANWTPPKTSFVEITSLPEERQIELRQYMDEYRQAMQLEQQVAAAESRLPDNVSGVQRDLLRQHYADEARASFIDDRQPATAATQPQPHPQPHPQPQQPSSPPQPTPESPPSAGIPDTPENCPRCYWPVRQAMKAKPTEDDKNRFVAAVLGLRRFEQSFTAMGDRIVVYFRSLDSEDATTLQLQLSSMLRSGEINGSAEYLANARVFRMVMSVSRIELGGKVAYSSPPVAEWAKAKAAVATTPEDVSEFNDPTALRRMRASFMREGVPQETLQRIVTGLFTRFEELTEQLEALTAEPDFWNGIDMPV